MKLLKNCFRELNILMILNIITKEFFTAKVMVLNVSSNSSFKFSKIGKTTSKNTATFDVGMFVNTLISFLLQYGNTFK